MAENPLKIVLASASPRRAELLSRIGVKFTVRPVAVDEIPLIGEEPRDFALRMAMEKAERGRKGEDELVIGCDTVVVVDGTILGKPRDAGEARTMLKLLSGRSHSVITAVALAGERNTADFAETVVEFDPMDEGMIDWYVRTGEPMDKAGAYGIQGLAALFVRRIEGPYDNIVGLPVNLLAHLLAELGCNIIELF
ncbi:MAG TPA: Maf family protein [Acidobacteriota bacterium]|nr:Maf family protein [Acidobacteriota bacterium]